MILRLRSQILVAAVAAFCSVGAAVDGTHKSIPWASKSYTLLARQMPLREALESFGVSEGIPVISSPGVRGTLAGDFKDLPPSEFLDKVAALHSLVWYYDGSAIHVSAVNEVVSRFVELRHIKVAEVSKMMISLGVDDPRYPLKAASEGGILMLSGPPRYVAVVSELIARAETQREAHASTAVETRVIPLKHTWADDVNFSVEGIESQATVRGVARMLEEIMASARQSPKVVEAGVTNSVTDGAMAQGFVPVIRPDNRLNAVIIRDRVSQLPVYERLVAELDRPEKLVEIQVTTLEMSETDALDWQLSLRADAVRNNISSAAGQETLNLADAARLATRGLAGAITYLGDDVKVSASLSAVREKGKARSISRSSILTLNNMSAAMSDMESCHARIVGKEVAELKEVTAGTRMQVKPRIVEEGVTNGARRVWLTLKLEDGGFEAVSVDAMPMTRTATLETHAAVEEGGSILLAGYLRKIKEDAHWGIPYLRDIPGIGWFFGGKTERDDTVRRLFILTPHIIDAEAVNVLPAQAVRQSDTSRPLSGIL